MTTTKAAHQAIQGHYTEDLAVAFITPCETTNQAPDHVFAACQWPERPDGAGPDDRIFGASLTCPRCRPAIYAHALTDPNDIFDYYPAVLDLIGLPHRPHRIITIVEALTRHLETIGDPTAPHYRKPLETLASASKG